MMDAYHTTEIDFFVIEESESFDLVEFQSPAPAAGVNNASAVISGAGVGSGQD